MKNEIIEWIKTILLSLVIALIITTFAKPTIVKNYSMSPTLEENDFLIINRFLYKRSVPKRGDIIVFESNLKTDKGKEKLLIKRIIAIPGDELVIREGNIYINGKQLEEDYIAENHTAGNIDLTVPEDEIFVMGDNRGNSLDSRDGILGSINYNTIIGKAFVRLYPFNKIGLLR